MDTLVMMYLCVNLITTVEEVLNFPHDNLICEMHPAEKIRYEIEAKNIPLIVFMVIAFPGLLIAYYVCQYFFE